jgi:hypothetical protein
LQADMRSHRLGLLLQDYDLDYDDDDDAEEDEDVDAENMYYRAKGPLAHLPCPSCPCSHAQGLAGANALFSSICFFPFAVAAGLVEDEPEEALQAFKAIVDQEDDKGDWYVSLLDLLYLSPFPSCPSPIGFGLTG